MKAIRNFVFVIITLMPCVSLAAEWTVQQNIVQVQYDGDLDNTWIIPTAALGSPSCPNAYGVVIQSSVPGRKQLLSIALAAQMAGKKVSFWGTCANTATFFATMIIVNY